VTGADPMAGRLAEAGHPGRSRHPGHPGHHGVSARPLRILVDGRVMQDRYHGIGRYTYEMLRELSLREAELVVLYSPEIGRLKVGELVTRPTIRAMPSRVPVVSLRSQWLLARAALSARPDVVFIPYHLSTPTLAPRVPVVSVIHDCVFERDAATHGSSASSVAYRAATRIAIRSAAALVTPSQATRRDITRFYGTEVPDEAVLPHGVGAQFFSLAGRPRPSGLSLPDRYILHVGAQRPHKNQRVLVEAMAALRARHPGLGLVLVGQPDRRFADEVGRLVTALGLSDVVYRYASVGDRELLGLYANAAVFAYPSLAEGFGMPILEAMAAGLAVVASDAEAVREVAAGGSLIVPAQTAAAWIQALDRVLTDPAVGRDLRERGHAIAARHTWARSAESTLSLLTSAASAASTAGAARRGPARPAGAMASDGE
jgi:glycosyltransferase involved in cell wall biosynthesis